MGTNQTLPEALADQMEKRIAEGTWPFGSKIPTEPELMKMYGVSRLPVREAVKSLVSKGVLEIRRGKGTFVCVEPGVVEDPLGLKFIQDEDTYAAIFEVRKVIEPAVARLAAERATEDEINKLGDLAERFYTLDSLLRGETTPPKIVQALYENDLEFHTLLCQMSRNVIFERFLPVIIKTMMASYKHLIRRISNSARVSTHYRIYEAIRHRNGELASELMLKHLDNSSNGLLNSSKPSDSAST